MTADALLDGDNQPADIDGHGPIPAGLARDLIAAAAAQQQPGRATDRVRVFLRRLFTNPVDHTVPIIDTGRRRFDADLARFMRVRDGGICRTPGREAPIAHLDHVVPHRAGGATTATNGQGSARPEGTLTAVRPLGCATSRAWPAGRSWCSAPPRPSSSSWACGPRGAACPST